MTHTKDLLAAELRKIGLNEMADRAARICDGKGAARVAAEIGVPAP